MAKTDRFVPGIYTYCDRWCERCEFTGRCRVYRDTQRTLQRHRRKGEDPRDVDRVLSDVDRSFERAARLLARYAKAKGLDLDEMAKAGADGRDEARRERKIDAHPMVLTAQRYMKLCGELLTKLRAIFSAARHEAARRAGSMDVEAEADDLARIREAFEVLSWDHMLIGAKTRRSVSGRLRARAEADHDLRRAAEADAAGSASVARRCLRRSKAALLAVYEWDEQFQDEAIELLAAAEKLLRALEREIPGCATFAWPPAEAAENAPP